MNPKTFRARLMKRLLCIVCAIAGGCSDSSTLRYDPQPPDTPAPILSVTPDALTFDAKGGTLVLNLTTTTAAWKIESPSVWLTIQVEYANGTPHGSPGGGAGNFSIRISAAPNETNARRTASIRVSGNGADTVTIPVEQKGFAASDAPSLSVEPSSLAFKADGETLDLIVTTDAAAWTATCKAAWMTIKSGSDAMLRATAMPNPTASPRSTTILFTAEDVDPFEVSVTQAAHSESPSPLSTLERDVHPSLATASATFYADDRLPNTLRRLQLNLFGDLMQHEIDNLMLTLCVDAVTQRTGAIEGRYAIVAKENTSPDSPEYGKGAAIAGTLIRFPDNDPLFEGSWYRMLTNETNQVRLTGMAPCTEGEIVVERNEKTYSIAYRLVDDNEIRPHTIAGSYTGTVEFTNLISDTGASPL